MTPDNKRPPAVQGRARFREQHKSCETAVIGVMNVDQNATPSPFAECDSDIGQVHPAVNIQG